MHQQNVFFSRASNWKEKLKVWPQEVTDAGVVLSSPWTTKQLFKLILIALIGDNYTLMFVLVSG